MTASEFAGLRRAAAVVRAGATLIRIEKPTCGVPSSAVMTPTNESCSS